MKFSNVGLSAFGIALPDEILTSRQIEKDLAPVLSQHGEKFATAGWFEAMTGIRERRVWHKNTSPSDAAILAAEDLFQSQTACARADIGAVLHCGVSRDYSEPATATIVHNKLGLRDDCLSFDISNACLGVLNGIVTAANMIELGQIRSAVVVSSEITGPLYPAAMELVKNSADRAFDVLQGQLAGFTLGSGAVALLLQNRQDAPEAHRLIGGAQWSNSAAWPLCRGNAQADHPSMQTDSAQLLGVGTENSLNAWGPFLEAVGWESHDIDLIAPHQVSHSLGEMTSRTLGYDQSKTAYTYPLLGNTASVAAPLTLALEARKPERIKAGDKVALLGTGSGVNSLFLGFDW